MDQVAPQFRAIANRRQAIGLEIAKLRSQIEMLESEVGELEVAARVLHRLGLLAAQDGPELPLPAPSTTATDKPTVPDMIRDIIDGFVKAGLQGATGQQVLAETTRRWGVSDPNIVRPTLWRMVKMNRLDREGDIYMPLSAGRTSDTPSSASRAIKAAHLPTPTRIEPRGQYASAFESLAE